MKTFFKILWLKISIRNLNSKRKNAILNISVNQAKEANRVEVIEDVNPTYFKEIDYKIESRKRLIYILSK